VLWSNLKIISAEVDQESSNSAHPMDVQQLANQQVVDQLLAIDISTTKIIRPTHMRVEAIAPDIDTLEGVIATFADATATIDIISKGVVCYSMAMVTLVVEQTPRMLSAAKLLISLEQSVPPGISSWDPAQAGDANTNGVRIQTLPSSILSVQSVVGRLSSIL